MMMFTTKSVAAGLIGALCLGAPVALHAEDVPPAQAPAAAPAPAAPASAEAVTKHATLEAQISFLGDSMAEGLGHLDWKMTLLSVDGVKTAGVTGKDLEILVLRAERDAVLDAQGGANGPQVLALGQAVRFSLGDTAALATLQAWAKEELPVVKPPDQALFKDQPIEAIKQQKAYTTYTQALSRRDYAILGLALIKQPGASDLALAALRSAADTGGGGGGGGGNPFGGGGPFGGGRGNMRFGGVRGNNSEPLILAALDSDPAAGFKALIDFASDEKVTLAQQATVLQTLARMAPGTRQRQAADEPFSLEADLAAQLPADSFAQLSKPYIAAVKRWKPEEGNFRASAVLMQLLAAGNDFPEKSISADGITAIQNLKDLIPGQQGQWMKPQVDALLKKQGADPAAATKPPAPPKDF
jgi:hypothetical protein